MGLFRPFLTFLTNASNTLLLIPSTTENRLRQIDFKRSPSSLRFDRSASNQDRDLERSEGGRRSETGEGRGGHDRGEEKK